MTDKIQKIREEVVRLKSQLLRGACSSQIAMETRCKEEAYDEVLTLLDSMQEEPKKCMYAQSNYTNVDRLVLCARCKEECKYAQKEADWLQELHCKLDSLSKEDFKKVFDKYAVDFNEEPVSEDLNTELDKYIKEHFTIDKEQLDRFGLEEKDYMYSMDKSDMLILIQHFANWQKEKDNLSVSEDLEKAGKEWLTPQLDKSYEPYGENKMMELTKFDGYSMMDAIEFGTNWKKEQMMAKAIDGVVTFDYYDSGDKTYGCIAHDSFCLEDFGLKDTDKVKVIVIKED